MAEDELELDTLGDRKSALFVILCGYGQHLQFCGGAHVHSQLFNLLCDKADDFYGGACRSMCGACWTSLRTSAKSRTSTS